jgi:hypothetical protein
MNCKNCSFLIQENDNFCPSCGGKVIRNRLTIKNLFEHFSEQFLNYDNKFLQTFIRLFTKPEDVIEGYINGTRKKYVNVISFFAISLTIAGLQLYLINKFFPEIMDLSSLTTEGTEEFQKKNLDFMQEYQSIIMMFYVPLYALMSKIVFFNLKKFNYTEHLVIFMYILSHVTIISAIITLFAALFGLTIGTLAIVFTLPYQIIYSAYCLKRLFGLSLKAIILRTILFLVLLGILMLIIAIVGAVVAIVFKDSEFMQSLIEAQKAAKEASGN